MQTKTYLHPCIGPDQPAVTSTSHGPPEESMQKHLGPEGQLHWLQ